MIFSYVYFGSSKPLLKQITSEMVLCFYVLIYLRLSLVSIIYLSFRLYPEVTHEENGKAD